MAMKMKKIKTFFTRLAGLVLLAGFVVLVAAAMKIRSRRPCKDILVEIAAAGDNFFIESADIRALLTDNKKINPVGKTPDHINMQLLERRAETNPWVENAELYLDNRSVLNVRITQKQPVSRIFTRSGNSFYIDAQGGRIPVMRRFAARVPVFTNFPSDAVLLHSEDSLLYTQMVAMGRFISEHPFWNAQVTQVNINRKKEFELIPKVGSQLILFGEATDIPEKFGKLMLFYKKGLSHLGWSMYDTIDIRYDHEVVCMPSQGIPLNTTKTNIRHE
jgi:cell division protein FtsQ